MRKERRHQINASLDDALFERVELFCLAHGVARAAVATAALRDMLDHQEDPWVLGYVEGLRTAQKDIAPALSRVLEALHGTYEAVQEYGRTIKEETFGTRGRA